jgi:hypothetical protein
MVEYQRWTPRGLVMAVVSVHGRRKSARHTHRRIKRQQIPLARVQPPRMIPIKLGTKRRRPPRPGSFPSPSQRLLVLGPHRHHVPISQPPQQINRPRLGIKHHLVTTPRDRPVLFERGIVAHDMPPFGLDIIHPKIVEGLIPVPAPKKINVPVVGIDTHGVSTALGGCIAIGVHTVQTPPLGVWLAGLEIGLEEACGRGLCKERFGVIPLAFENEGGVQRRHDGMLKLDLRTGEDRLVGRQEASFAEVLEYLSKDNGFAMLHAPDV